VTLEEAKAKLTEREFDFLQAMLAQDQAKLHTFGDDAVLLAKNVEYKIQAAGGLSSGPEKVQGAGTQLTLFAEPAPEPVPEPAPEESTKAEFEERPAKKIKIPGVPGASTVMPRAGALDGLERKSGDGPAMGELSRSRDALDEHHKGGHAPFRKGDVIQGDRVLWRATQGIHRVKGVDRTTEPHTLKLEAFGKLVLVSREMVNKVAPNGFDRRWQQRRGSGRHVPRYPTQHSEAQVDGGYDPQDNSS